MQIYAHRGWSSQFPENTLRAFAEAKSLGVAGIELDVQLTSDGIPVVIHDRELARTTNGLGLVDQTSFADLQRFDAGDGERVPSLREVLDLVGDAVHLDIEIKAPDADNATLANLREFPIAQWAISSFNWRVLRRLRDVDDSIELWPLAVSCDAALLNVAKALGSPVVALESAAYTEETATTLRGAGLRAFLWTINQVVEARRVDALGAFAICTDDPSRLIER